MKGLTTLSVFAFFYLVIIIIFNEAGGEPFGIEVKNTEQSNSGAEALKKDLDESGAKHEKNSSCVGKAKFGKVATDPSQNGETGNLPSDTPITHAQRAAAVDSNNINNKPNDTNPLADLFQIGDPTTRTALGAIYGAYKGNDQCSRKAFCMMGNYMKDMPGRDLIFLFMGNYIPPEYSLYYEIFKVAVLYGQNCDVYVCVPDSSPPDAASAAARPSTKQQPAPSQQKQNAQPSQQDPNATPKKPTSLDDAFGNNIPR